MKKIYLIILFVLLLPVTSSFALVPITETGQQVLIPYAQVGSGWWSGLVIHNTSSASMTFVVGAYTQDSPTGTTTTWVPGISFSVPAHGMKVDLLENFFSSATSPTGRMSPVIKCATDGAPTFQATLLVGNEEGGFGFQNYTSWDWVHPIFAVIDPGIPFIIDPTPTIPLPKWPTIPTPGL